MEHTEMETWGVKEWLEELDPAELLGLTLPGDETPQVEQHGMSFYCTSQDHLDIFVLIVKIDANEFIELAS